jgi:hypothetical protein
MLLTLQIFIGSFGALVAFRLIDILQYTIQHWNCDHE